MTRRRTVNVLLLIWAVVFVLSIALAWLQEPTGDGFTRGLNRLGVFFGWQGVALAIAVIAWLMGRGVDYERPRSRWLTRIPAIIHASMVVLIVGLVVILRFSKPPADPVTPPGPPTATAPAVAPSAESAPAVKAPSATSEPAANVRRFNGIFRGGFEASHFYTMDGQGPWWLEASEADWDRINDSYVHGPGRAGGVRVAMAVDGWLEETGGELEYLGIDQYRIHVVSIDSIRPLSEEEFDMVLESITRR